MTTTNTASQILPFQASDNARAIIINIDDLGLSSAVNNAVLHLAECGRIGASSYMVGGTISESEMKTLTKLKVEIGLHFDLTGIFPSLLRGSLKSIIAASYLRKLNPAQVKDVISQQLDAFEDCFGRPPVFIDGHQHIHQFPIIRQHLIEEISTRYGKNPQTSISARVTTPLINDIKSWIIYALGGNAWRRLCEDHHIATNGRFGGVYGFEATSQELSALWETWLQIAPRTAGLPSPLNTQSFAVNTALYSLPTDLSPTLIMCHPALSDNDWQDDIKQAREREYEWLMSDQFGQLLQQYEVRLVRWSDVIASV